VALPAIPTFDADATGRSLGARSDRRRVALVACADSSTQKSAARWLTSTGFEVVTAVGAAEALDQFGRHRPVIVLTDMTLRNDRGRSLCEVLGQQAPWSRVPILALCSGQREAKAALEAGATAPSTGTSAPYARSGWCAWPRRRVSSTACARRWSACASP
jgi:CheY-like chemotaxis protein